MPYVKSHDIDIHYQVTGAGTSVVLLHSFLCSREMWRNQLEPLSSRYQVINIDGRGHGASGNVEEPFTLYDMVDDVTAVLDEIGVERAIWAGLSIGGMVALRAALTAADRVSGLILIDTDAGPENTWTKFEFGLMSRIAQYFGLRPVLRTVNGKMFGKLTRRDIPGLVLEWGERFATVHVGSALHTLNSVTRRDDLISRLPQLGLPALVIVGRDDTAFPLGRSESIARGLPDSELHVIDGVGHLVALEAPEQVTRLMMDFLDRSGERQLNKST